MNMRNPANTATPAPLSNLSTPSPEVRLQLDRIVRQLYEALSPNLVGIYLHGSLAMGCFNSASSDLDLLVVTHQAPDHSASRTVLAALLAASSQPIPVEISLVHYAQIVPWRYPPPYDLHFSEMHRASTAARLASSAAVEPSDGTDVDLAAHFTVLARRGVCLLGRPIDELGIDVPWQDYLDSLRLDMAWAREGNSDAVYAVLNACRTWAAVEDGLVLSKAEGARWASVRAPAVYGATIEDAARRYAGTHATVTASAVDGFVAWVRSRLEW